LVGVFSPRWFPVFAGNVAPFAAIVFGLGLIFGLAGLWGDAVDTGAFIGVVLNLIGLGIVLLVFFLVPPFRGL
jgi:hypothetical protein